ncbi:hypothetical protein ONS96_008488 [Cadophora gregata f. sp. sojae]|nr:hypothetical protein ONS96_008488 [Cadophora gregata f. sp. sojae]
MASPSSSGTDAAAVPADIGIASIVPDQGNQLEADSESIGDDLDSSLESDDDAQSITTSLSSSFAKYRMENGRSYHQYKDGQYAYPNDEIEKDRLDLQHHLFKLMMDQKLYLAPIKPNPQNVLDIGTGTGLWAIQFADENPSAQVIGTDLSPIQPTFIPPNLQFLIDDAGEDWVFSQKFDFIHARQLHCAVEEKRLIEQAIQYSDYSTYILSNFHDGENFLTHDRNLHPGGFFEMQELAFPGTCDDNSNPPSNALSKWNALMLEASTKMSKPLNNPPKYAEWMRDAGFTNVHSSLYKWPSNTWPKSKKEKTLGLWNMVNTLDGLEGFTMAMFTRVLGWTPEEVQIFLVDVRRDCKDRKLHNYWPV